MHAKTDRHAEFWTPERLAAAQAMRAYSRAWSACPEWQRWWLRGWVHALRAAGVTEGQIANLVHSRLGRLRPWRLTDRELNTALKAHYMTKRRRFSGK